MMGEFRLIDLMERFEHLNILVIGDVMLDRYLWGDVERISPEAPVPILHVREKTESAGGAGNVVLNLIGIGCSGTFVSVCGDDEGGEKLKKILTHEKINPILLTNLNWPTIKKTRLMAKNQQLKRLDEEDTCPLSFEIKNRILQIIKNECAKSDAIILSDYGKGVLSDFNVCQEIIQYGHRREIIIMVDPKSKFWERYTGATCVTPNTGELEIIFGDKLLNENNLLDAMKEVLKKFKFSNLLVTRGSKGMAGIDSSMNSFFIPTVAREVYDVSGAGDTVIATLTAALAAGGSFIEAAKLANTAAGIVVGKIGTQPISKIELETCVRINEFQTCANFSGKISSLLSAKTLINSWRLTGQKIVFTNGCFDLIHPGHIHFLNSASRLGDKLIIGLNSDESVKRLKGNNRPFLKEYERASILGSLDVVDLIIIFDEDTPENILNILKPDILVKGDDYKINEVVGKEIVESYGGKVQLIPILKGYSTTNLAQLVINANGNQIGNK